MRRFFYKVKTSQNIILHNYINASSITDAAEKLEHKGYIVLEIKEELNENSNNSSAYNKNEVVVLSLSEKKEFFNSFYSLYKSGHSVFEVFKLISASSKNIGIIRLCNKIIKGIEQGKSLKDSMKCCSKSIGLAYTMIIAAGEESGKLNESLSSIIKNITRQEEIKSNIINSLTHPLFIFFLAIAVGLIFKFFVIEIFNQSSGGSTGVNISAVAYSAGIKIVIIFALIFSALFFIYKNKNLINKILNFIIKIRVFEKILKSYSFSNFFSVLAMAYESGIPIAESVMLANSVIDIPEINKKIQKAETMIQNGCKMATALGVTGLFSGYALSQISAGENAGELDKTLKNAALDYENKLDISIKVCLKLVEPIMLIIVGIMVMFICVNGYKAYYNAIFSMF